MTCTEVTESACLRGSDGTICEPGARWSGPITEEDRTLLTRVTGPALDIGCGPGRHVSSLAAQGVPALGIDLAPAALAAARRDGAPVLRRSVFDRLPGFGRWRSALLLDGNVGIGADPARLLRRVARILRPGGELFVEVTGAGARSSRRRVTLEMNGHPGPWFWWRRVSADELAGLAAGAGMQIIEEWTARDRHFAVLVNGRR
jgi:SAM-dependent methyltransferase